MLDFKVRNQQEVRMNACGARISFSIARASLAVLAAVLAGCAARSNIPYDSAGFRAPDPVAALEVTQLYRLGPGDVVGVQVYRAADISGDRKVDDSGAIDIPLIGQVHALGSTTTELARTIEQRLGQAYYQNPQVSVTLKDALGRRATIDGSVRQPGVYPIDASTTLMRAVALAQGTTEDANTRRVVVFRTIERQRTAAAFDLQAIRAGGAPDPAIYGSDIIIVDGNGTRRLLRDLIQTIPLIARFRPF